MWARFRRSVLFLSAVLAPLAGCHGSTPSSPQTPQTPPGASFIVSGQVHEPPPTAGSKVGHVLLTVSDGSLLGRVFRTDTSGRFLLQPARDDVFTIRFHLPGYEDATYRVSEARDVNNVDIELRPEAGVVSFTARGMDACSDLPKKTVACEAGPNCWSGPFLTSFPVYHSGALVVSELEIPAWGSPSLDVIKIGPDGLAVWWGPNPSRPMVLEAGYRYTLGFSGDIVTCSPFRVSLVHPR